VDLQNGPKIVNQHYLCFDNKLISLRGGPEIVGWAFEIFGNYLTSLIYSPKIKRLRDFQKNHLLTLDYY
jgi:hypothetical protein